MFKTNISPFLTIFAPTEPPKASAQSAKNPSSQIMQFSKRVTELSRLHGVDAKDVLFAMLITAGASTAEAFAVIYRPTVSTSAALSTKAANYIGSRPGLKRLIKHLDEQSTAANTDTNNTGQASTPARRRGRPRKDDETDAVTSDRPSLDYTDKDAVLQELARIAERCDKESDRLAALREISALQKMKADAAVDVERRVVFYVPLNYDRCEELRQLLAERANKSSS